MPSIHDVAREAQVAASTVSLVINGSSRVSDKTRAKVQQVIDKLEYSPRQQSIRNKDNTSITKASNRAKSTLPLKHLLVLIGRRAATTGEPDALVSLWLHSIREKSRELGIHVSTHIGMNHVDNDTFFTSEFESGSYDAVILLKTVDNDGYLECVLQTNLPCVTLNHEPESRAFSVITLDYKQAGCQIAQRMLDLGHRRIAFLGDRQRWTLNEIAQGIEQVLREQQLELTLDLPLTTVSESAMQQAADQVLSQNITAVATFDPVALRLIPLLEAKGLVIPRDISVVGFDDLGKKTSSALSITTVGFPKALMGTLAIQTLVQHVLTGNALKSTTMILKCQLIEHDTLDVAPAPVTNQVIANTDQP